MKPLSTPSNPRTIRLVLLALCLAAPGRAPAHQQRLSYGKYIIHGSDMDARLRFAAADLAPLLKLDPGGDGKISQPDLDRLGPSIARLTLGQLSLHSAGEACSPAGEGHAALEGEDGIVITGAFHCTQPITHLELRLGFIAQLAAGHTHLALVSFDSEAPVEHVAQAGTETLSIERQASLGTTLLRFFLLGIEHILTGYDHIAFLIGLLLLGGTLKRLIGIISAFTVAHSITLALAALDIFSPPPRIIEPSIALSIIFVAVENLWALRSAAATERAQRALRHRWVITFAFGLVHGFGFASALRELNLPRTGLAASLVTFNLGVEAGQICIVALAFPALNLLSGRPRKQVALALSSVIALLGLYWFGQRILG